MIKEPISVVGQDVGVNEAHTKIESAIPYLIPKDMTLEQLHAKVGQYRINW